MAFSAVHLLYMTLAINKMDGCGLSNTACHEGLPRRLSNAVLATEGIHGNSNKMECFSYLGMFSDAFKIRVDFNFTVIILA